MKLKMRLILLAVGAIIIPIIVTGLAGYLGHIYSSKRYPIKPFKIERAMRDLQKELGQNVEHRITGEYISSHLDFPEGLNVLVLDIENNIIFSNISDIPQGPIRDEKAFFRVLRGGSKKHQLLMAPIIVDDQVRATVVLSFLLNPQINPPKDKKHPPFFVFILQQWLFGLIAFVFFAVVMVSLIMRSLNRSITKLERATSKVAGGDLDFKLNVQGNDEIASLSKSFETMRLKLKDSTQQRSRFLMGVSHDLKTPLTSIEGYLEAISDGLANDPEKLKKYISIIQEKSKVLEERIVQLIDFVKVETGDWKPKNEEINLSEFLGQLVTIYQEDASVFKRTFHSHIDLPQSFTVFGDRTLIARAFENIITNAIQYTEDDDSIIVRAYTMNRGATVCIEDTGPGITKEEIDKIFEPFYRGTPSRRAHGTGLGLSMVKSIFNSYGWMVDVVSHPNKGTIFKVYIKLFSAK